MDKSQAYLVYHRSAEVDWDDLWMEAPFLFYGFATGSVSGLADGGAYYGRRIDVLGPRCDLAGFPAVSVASLTESWYTLDEASEAGGEGSGQREVAPRSCVTGISFLEEAAAAGWVLSSLVAFCYSKGIVAPL